MKLDGMIIVFESYDSGRTRITILDQGAPVAQVNGGPVAGVQQLQALLGIVAREISNHRARQCPPHAFVGGDSQCSKCFAYFPDRDPRVLKGDKL